MYVVHFSLCYPGCFLVHLKPTFVFTSVVFDPLIPVGCKDESRIS